MEDQAIWDILRDAAKNGGLTIAKICNTRENIGKHPTVVLAEQLKKLGYVIRQETNG